MRRLRLEGGHRARSLVWDGERLVHLASGGRSVTMDGTTSPNLVLWGYPFDLALLGPSGSSLAVLWAVAGTKGMVVDRKAGVLRELDRSYYFAHAYEYPVAVGAAVDGTPLLVHCPDAYNRLAIERLDDGERLAAAGERSSDVFHSRLALSPGGRSLLSAGWLWHPVGDVRVYDVAEAIADSRHLEGRGVLPLNSIDTDVEVACWLDDDRLVVGTNPRGSASTMIPRGSVQATWGCGRWRGLRGTPGCQRAPTSAPSTGSASGSWRSSTIPG